MTASRRPAPLRLLFIELAVLCLSVGLTVQTQAKWTLPWLFTVNLRLLSDYSTRVQ